MAPAAADRYFKQANLEIEMMTLKIAAAMLAVSCAAASAATLDVTEDELEFLDDTAQVSMLAHHGNGAANGVDELFVAPDEEAGKDHSAGSQFVWSVNKVIAFAFSYDADGGFGGQGLLTATLDGVSAIFGDVVGEVIAAKMSFNALGITVEGPNANAETLFTLGNLQINGADVALGSFGSSVKEKNEFGVTGFGEVSDFSVTGTVLRTGTDLRGRPSLEMTMGTVEGGAALKAVAPVPVPAALPMLMLAFGCFGVMARRRRS
jgi:hypothetical protein